MSDPINDYLNTDIESYLIKQSDETLYNLGLTPEFAFPLELKVTDPAQYMVFTQPSVSVPSQPPALPPAQPGTVPAAASKRFKALGGAGLNITERREIAQWMAAEAQARGFPPELPVMAALTETGDTLRNLVDGDRDSVGFFQIRVSIHGQSAVESPGAQLNWFFSTAQRSPLGRSGRAGNWTKSFLESQISAARAANDEGLLSVWLGRWCQDIERSAYPERYQQRYPLARKLIYGR